MNTFQTIEIFALITITGGVAAPVVDVGSQVVGRVGSSVVGRVGSSVVGRVGSSDVGAVGNVVNRVNNVGVVGVR